MQQQELDKKGDLFSKKVTIFAYKILFDVNNKK